MLSSTVRTLAPTDWRTYKDLRLRALAQAPEAFGSTLAREQGRSDAKWAERLAADANAGWNLPVVAEVDGEPIGLAWGRIEETEPNVASLYQVWVDPRQRGRGAGQRLLEAVIAWAWARQADALELGVAVGDTPATRLYIRAGFKPVGPPEPLRPDSEGLFQPMRLNLKSETD